ncbi:MAG: alpha-amylase [Treponema sp.]|jgi:glycosidase|nr:alpha-amylase [Treponema sp.]
MEFLQIPLFLKNNWMRPAQGTAFRADSCMALREFHIRRDVREEYELEHGIFSLRGNVVLANIREARNLTRKINAKIDPRRPEKMVKAGQLNAMGLIDEILHYMVALYREQVQADVFETALGRLESQLGSGRIRALLETFSGLFPPRTVYAGKTSIDDYLKGSDEGESNRSLALEEIMLLALANLNPAFKSFIFMFDDRDLEVETVYPEALELLRSHLAELPPFGPDGQNLWDLLRAPALASPDSLSGQLDFMRRNWGLLLGKFLSRILMGLDVIKEEEKPSFFGPGPMEALTFGGLDEYERFSPDQEWMPKTVLLAKSTLVWLFQLSKKYGREITRLDQIPDEELDELAHRGFTGLWLIGLWERSNASRTIKQWTGNPEAAASAYSLYDYDIAGELGGWGALANLRDRCYRRGIRLGSDMVPNHTGIDSRWIVEHPERFLQLPYPPFPAYNYNCGNLSGRDDITVQIEEHYFDHSDCAVVFKRIDNRTGETRYIYHGNDGTSMPWNDTAQIDFLNEEAREAVIRTIIGVCKQFPIVRFDAAMTLAKRHIQRLWYPEPGRGGDIASRAEHAISAEEFNRRIPNEFWREVVDRCAAEAPNTLLLAEAFWMMEGYFVRTLGMHRVYNSAFMNMLKKEENSKYRDTIRNTLEFDPEILKRFVNFMNNPDEETAAAQFGKGDKYFGICTLLVTMPGLPMFGHGQIEGFEEKYGMEYRRAYRDEKPDRGFVDRHERDIFPLMKKRYLFSGSADFCLFDLWDSNGSVNENVFAYSNRAGGERTLVLYNNAYSQASGWIREGSANIPQKDGTSRRDSLGQAIGLNSDDRFFVLFREQRQNRWFIRSSKEIAERGLFVSLNGYEAQVFLDIHEVMDSAPGSAAYRWDARWSKLNAELNGRGVWDLDAALKDIFLGELYAPFAECFTHGRFAELSALVTAPSAKKKEAAVFAESFEKPAETLLACALKFLDGADGRYEPFPADPAKSQAAHRVSAPESDSKTVQHAVKDFVVYLEALLTLGKEAKKPNTKPAKTASKTAPDSKTVNKQDALTEKFLRSLAEALSARPVAAAFGLGYGLLRLLRAVSGKGAGGGAGDLAEHWGLDRKLREAFEGLGVPGDEAWRVIAIMKAVLARTGAAGKTAPPREITAQSLLLENYDAGDFRSILKVNFFENAVWFNKEAFEEALFYVPLFTLLEYGQTRAAAIALAAEQFRKAEAASEYKLDRLIDLLAPKTPSAKNRKTAGGSGEGKTAASTKTAASKAVGAKAAAAKTAGAKKEPAKPKGRNEKNRK